MYSYIVVLLCAYGNVFIVYVLLGTIYLLHTHGNNFSALRENRVTIIIFHVSS